jgi:hypothetical protein
MVEVVQGNREAAGQAVGSCTFSRCRAKRELSHLTNPKMRVTRVCGDFALQQ